MSKKIKAFVKLALVGGKATPAPPVGPALGQHGVNIGSFCKEYNSRTSDMLGTIVPVKISIFEDKSYTFILKSPPASILILKNAGKEKGSSQSSKGNAGSLNLNQIEEIAKIKLQDLNTKNIEKAKKIIIGTAKNMGVLIEKS